MDETVPSTSAHYEIPDLYYEGYSPHKMYLDQGLNSL